jgi:hypothetical protein
MTKKKKKKRQTGSVLSWENQRSGDHPFPISSYTMTEFRCSRGQKVQTLLQHVGHLGSAGQGILVWSLSMATIRAAATQANVEVLKSHRKRRKRNAKQIQTSAWQEWTP